ncbi:HU family DNA-binding protein [Pseudodesulfovibrio pelocollis]|uniref:HU family DNA-binding protein n=1 Tax=Pseudodesulfovibrio pelocollis TaxID=3051432 RepID=UPI00255B02DF|nr:HU family DNA-binding protein [Pseudodesulfovibrio sp. SB368]
MNKKELIAAMAKKTGGSNADALRNLEALQDVIKSELGNGGKISLTGFGSFKVSERKGRTGRNPRTGAEIKIPACKVVQFSVGKELKEAVN